MDLVRRGVTSPRLPKRIVIVGGGYIGVEFAHIFRGFGAQVTLLHRDTRVLRGFDPEIREHVHLGLVRAGIHVECGVKLVDRDATHVIVCDDKGTGRIETDLAMAAIGRAPLTAGLGLAEAGVALSDNAGVVVDDFSRSSVAHIFAVGDVTERVALRRSRSARATPSPTRCSAASRRRSSHHLIPTAVFSQPPAATIGFSEPAALAAGHEVAIFRAKFRPMRYALSGRDETVLIKLVVDRATDKVLGLHMTGPDAPEIVRPPRSRSRWARRRPTSTAPSRSIRRPPRSWCC